MLRVHSGAFQKVVGDLRRIAEGVGGGPVGEGHQPLLPVPAGLVLDDVVHRLGQHGLEGGGVLGGGHIGTLVGGTLRVFVVGVGDGHVLPLHAQDIADHPIGHVVAVAARTQAPA